MRVQYKAVSAGAAIILAIFVTACGQMSTLQARKAFKDANGLYQAQNYREAATRYEEAIQSDPNLTEAYFFLGNSYDNLYRPSRRGEAENDVYLTKAIDNYRIAGERSQDPKVKRLALEYLVASYGPDKLNDPSQSEPVLQKMIEMDPTESANYIYLAKIYEENGNYEGAEANLLKAKEARPNDAGVYMSIAGYYNRQGEFDKTIEALQQRAAMEPENPEAHYTIASYYWDKTYRDFRLTDKEKQDYILKGLESVEKALQLKADYVEAVVYKGLLLRLQANGERNVGRQQALIKEAEELQQRAAELKKKSAAGV